jgi:hypothetical protein
MLLTFQLGIDDDAPSPFETRAFAEAVAAQVRQTIHA